MGMCVESGNEAVALDVNGDVRGVWERGYGPGCETSLGGVRGVWERGCSP